MLPRRRSGHLHMFDGAFCDEGSLFLRKYTVRGPSEWFVQLNVCIPDTTYIVGIWEVRKGVDRAERRYERAGKCGAENSAGN